MGIRAVLPLFRTGQHGDQCRSLGAWQQMGTLGMNESHGQPGNVLVVASEVEGDHTSLQAPSLLTRYISLQAITGLLCKLFIFRSFYF